MSEKTNYELNISILSSRCKDIIEKIKELCKFKEENENIKKDNNLETNITSFWNWIPINCNENEIDDNLLLLIGYLKDKINACSDKNNNQAFKEVFIIEKKDISETKFTEFLDTFDENLEDFGEYYHPFIIFLTNEELKIEYENYNKIDSKKIFTFPFPDDELSISKLVFKLIQCCSYYNELGDYFCINGYPYQAIPEIENYSTYLNILLLGRSQSGKSTFINLLLGEKRAKEGGINCGCSQKKQIYKILNYPVRLYDTVGFGDEDKDIEEIKNFFKKLDDELTNSKEKIHLILYFIDGKAGNKFGKNEIFLLKEIQSRNILILYIVTKFVYNPNKKPKKYKNELEKIYNSMTSKVGINNEHNFEKFLGVNLVKNDKTRETEEFGFKEIIENIYYYFKKDAEKLREIKEKYNNTQNEEEKEKKKEIDWEKIFPSLENNLFFSHLKTYKDIEDKYEEEARKAIKNAIIKAGITGWFPVIDMISHHFVKKSLQNNIEKAYKLNKNENKDEKDEEKKEEESKEEKEFGEKIDKNVESSYSNLARAAELIKGASGYIIVINTVSSALSLGGLRKAGRYALMGAQIIIGPLVGIYKMSKNGDEMIKLYKEKFREKNYDCTLALIDSILSGILFFEELLESFNKINE